MSVALALHLLCLVLLAAGGVGGTFLHVSVVRHLRDDPRAAATLGRVGAVFGMVASASALLMLATGVLLLRARGWGDLGHTWLTAKLALFVVLFLNGLLVAKPTGARLGAALGAVAAGHAPVDDALVAAPLARMTRFHAVQTAGLVTLILLGVFGPR